MTCATAARTLCLDTPPCCCRLAAALSQANYGKDDEVAVLRVKAVYRELQLEELFK